MIKRANTKAKNNLTVIKEAESSQSSDSDSSESCDEQGMKK
jgi:hypothetical protein